MTFKTKIGKCYGLRKYSLFIFVLSYKERYSSLRIFLFFRISKNIPKHREQKIPQFLSLYRFNQV